MNGNNAVTIQAIELASRKAWPALEEYETSNGVFRFAEGVSRRSNSLSPATQQAIDAARVMAASEQFYWQRGLPSIVRVVAPGTSLSVSSYLLDTALAAAGYETQAPTAVLLMPLSEQAADSARPPVGSLSPQSWLQAFYGINDSGREDFAVRLKILQAITEPACLLVMEKQDRIAATAMAVLSESLLGIYGVATAPAWRRQGLARELIQKLLAWGSAQGARYAYLQVEKDNQAALALYSGMGFDEFYSYWYRVKAPLTNLQQCQSQQEIRA